MQNVKQLYKSLITVNMSETHLEKLHCDFTINLVQYKESLCYHLPKWDLSTNFQIEWQLPSFVAQKQ